MHLICLFLVSSLMGSATAQLQCDPLTQYVQDGQCCLMCAPGTSMSSEFRCREPQCKECGKDEYQDKYTKESKCQRQPYCDPNKNFEVAVQESKSKRIECKCKEGFHCSSGDCITCVPHKICQPGTKIRVEGNPTRDTECVKCPEGTYSNESSSKDCRKMTKCTTSIKQEGTDTSDNICAPEMRAHWIVIIVLASLVVTALSGVLIWHFEGYSKIKDYCGSCNENKNKPLTNIIVAEDRTPEENEDDPSIQETLIHLTDNKNLVAQENGKEEILSSVSTGNSTEIPVETIDSTYDFSTEY